MKKNLNLEPIGSNLVIRPANDISAELLTPFQIQVLNSVIRFLNETLPGTKTERIASVNGLVFFTPAELSLKDEQEAIAHLKEVCFHHNYSAVCESKQTETAKGTFHYFTLHSDFTTELGSRFATRMGVTEESCAAHDNFMTPMLGNG